MRQLRFLLAVSPAIISFFYSTAARADERLLVDATINDKSVRLAFDTGAGNLILFRQAALRLGLRVTNAPPDVHLKPGQVPLGTTEKCRLTLLGTSVETSCAVFDLPAYLPINVDGVLGWQCIKNNIFRIDANGLTVTPLAKVPKRAKKWARIPLDAKSEFLQMELSRENGEKIAIDVDTGSANGVALYPTHWHQWRATHTNQAVTLSARYMPGVGLVVSEEAWAKQLSFGPLVLNDVPVMEANSTQTALGGPHLEAVLGLAALKRLDFVVDGRKGVVYLHPKTATPPPYEHNRIGAVFVPRDSENDDLVARVVETSPAYEAGIRKDDVLLKIEELDVTKWRTDPAVLPLSRFWEKPVGTRLDLTLKRANEVFKTAVVLRDILSLTTSLSAQRDLQK